MCGEWAHSNNGEYNQDKSNVFNSKGEGQDSIWNLLGVKVAVATSYKYLGVTFVSDLSWKIMKEDRIQKAKQNLNMVLAMGVRRGIAPNIAMQLISGSVYQSMDWGSTGRRVIHLIIV